MHGSPFLVIINKTLKFEGDSRMIKAIMCDVDGTLLNSQGVVSPYTIEQIKKIKAQGMLFGLATGRDVHSVKKQLNRWGIDGLVDAIVGTGGAEIADFQLNVEKSSYPLEGKVIRQVIEHYQDLDVNFAIPWQGELYSPKDDEYIRKLSEADHIPYHVVDYHEFLNEPRPKVMIVCDPARMGAVIARSHTFTVPKTKSAGLITASILFEYMDPRVSKTEGLKEFMTLHGLTMDELCTFGDADNDYDMTVNAKIGVVMANGSEKTKSAADYITDDHDHDGIGRFIAEHFLNHS